MKANSKALLGAALLAAGRPVKLSELTQVLGIPPHGVQRLIHELELELKAAQIGFEIEAVAGGYRLVVPPELAQQLSPLFSPPALPSLSGAALEVLAVIAYRQPVTRAEIEAMRGGSASTVLTLQERELIKVVGRADAVGHPLLYGTTERFLLEFGLSSLSDLPTLEREDSEFSGLLRG